jgi:MerR family transcriptional regulator, thiopeptide resistance regulator
MMTVTRLARSCGLSRSTVLYYESIGLLRASARSPGNYREYSEKDTERLRQICAYRHAGLSLADIRSVLGGASSQAAAVLERRLVELDREIEALRDHQRAILRLLGHRSFRRNQMITKDKWVAIMKGCGLTEEQMHAWHGEFERAAPDEHQEFLEFLHIPAEEIRQIREHSRIGARK